VSTPQITVLTAVHNGAEHVGETIASIEAQTFRDWEYVLIDDASTDATPEILAAAARKNPKLRIVRRDHAAGPYVAANEGLRLARGKWIVRTDADDLSPAHRIERQVAFLSQHREFRACVSFWQGFNQSGPLSHTVTPIPMSSGVFRWYLMLRSPSIHSSVCYEREAILELGGYRELPLSQDYRLWCEMSRRNWLGTIPEVLSYVRYHEGRESLMKRRLQRDLAFGVLADHMQEMTGRIWGTSDLETLWAVGHSEPLPVGAGLRMIDWWEASWRAASGLTVADRRELERLSAFRRWRHLRANVRGQVVSSLLHGARIVSTRPRSIIPSAQFCY
jgi:glycosyltransferase involved in cell wall biosynthesis